ncbi:MAG: glycosyltransferase family 4 protein [Gammaproteobacteria bacterium]
MHILIVSQYFWPENFRINDLAQGLLERGHEVTVLTGLPNYPEGRISEGYLHPKHWREDYRGAEVIRVPLIARGAGGGIRLALNYLSFALAASLMGPWRLAGKKFDAVFVFEVSPITVGLPAALIRRLKNAPLLFWVLDLWPESLSATGHINNRAVLGLVDGLVRFIYRRCDRILVSSRGFRERIGKQGVEPERIDYFPNWAESLFLGTDSDSGTLDTPLPKGFVLMFAGNIGASQDFETILAAAEQLRDRTDIHFVILGSGRRGDWVATEVRARKLEHSFHLLGRKPLEDMPLYFAHADAMLVSLKSQAIFDLTLPGKVQSYMACGRPVLAMLAGEGVAVIEESGAGVATPPGDASALAQSITHLADMPRDEREEMGQAGLDYYRAHFDREMLLDKLERWVEGTPRPGSHPDQRGKNE